MSASAPATSAPRAPRAQRPPATVSVSAESGREEPFGAGAPGGSAPAVVAGGLEDLLAWADQYTDRTRALAGGVRAGLSAIGRVRDRAQAKEAAEREEAELSARVQALRAQIAALEAQEAAEADTSAAAPEEPTGLVAALQANVALCKGLSYSEAVRSWARREGAAVGKAGVISRVLVHRWIAAHPDEAAAGAEQIALAAARE